MITHRPDNSLTLLTPVVNSNFGFCPTMRRALFETGNKYTAKWRLLSKADSDFWCVESRQRPIVRRADALISCTVCIWDIKQCYELSARLPVCLPHALSSKRCIYCCGYYSTLIGSQTHRTATGSIRNGRACRFAVIWWYLAQIIY